MGAMKPLLSKNEPAKCTQRSWKRHVQPGQYPDDRARLSGHQRQCVTTLQTQSCTKRLSQLCLTCGADRFAIILLEKKEPWRYSLLEQKANKANKKFRKFVKQSTGRTPGEPAYAVLRPNFGESRILGWKKGPPVRV